MLATLYMLIVVTFDGQERAKAVVAAQAARAKREKAKQRKKARAHPDQNRQGQGASVAKTGGKPAIGSDGKPKKRVAFN